MRVSEFTEDHPYWGTLRRSQIYYPEPRAVNAVEARNPHGEQTYAQAIDGGRYPPINPEYVVQRAGGRRRKGMSVSARNRGKAKEKRFGLADPVV
ncbi:hypothetical protein F5Y04DRAFT_160673 [Hypomontagnella monticulosa]|nr:hypothetical protein F5Y04DRAFT_160673 [Hypomontagnella monticulosa]